MWRLTVLLSCATGTHALKSGDHTEVVVDPSGDVFVRRHEVVAEDTPETSVMIRKREGEEAVSALQSYGGGMLDYTGEDQAGEGDAGDEHIGYDKDKLKVALKGGKGSATTGQAQVVAADYTNKKYTYNAKGWCKHYEYLPWPIHNCLWKEHKIDCYPDLLSAGNPMFSDDKAEECMYRCLCAYNTQADKQCAAQGKKGLEAGGDKQCYNNLAFYIVNSGEKKDTCGCSLDNCAATLDENWATSFSIKEEYRTLPPAFNCPSPGDGLDPTTWAGYTSSVSSTTTPAAMTPAPTTSPIDDERPCHTIGWKECLDGGICFRCEWYTDSEVSYCVDRTTFSDDCTTTTTTTTTTTEEATCTNFDGAQCPGGEKLEKGQPCGLGGCTIEDCCCDSFFGCLSGNHHVFVLDKSSSMTYALSSEIAESFECQACAEGSGGDGWDRRRRRRRRRQKVASCKKDKNALLNYHMVKVLNKMRTTDTFNIVFYDKDAAAAYDQTIQATEENVKKAIQTVLCTPNGHGTHSGKGLKIAYAMKDVDHIYFFTDGVPNGAMSSGQILQMIEREKITVSAIHMYDPKKNYGREMIEWMQDIASATGGTYMANPVG